MKRELRKPYEYQYPIKDRITIRMSEEDTCGLFMVGGLVLGLVGYGVYKLFDFVFGD